MIHYSSPVRMDNWQFLPFELFEDTVGVFRELLLHVWLQDLVQGLGVLELAKEEVVPGLFVFRVLEKKQHSS